MISGLSYFSLIVSVVHFLFCVSYLISFGCFAIPACIALILSSLLTYGENE